MPQRPNLLILMSDQWRYDACGHNGSTICQTPHLDHLAQQGMRFTHAFASAPVCSPTRASLWSGQWPSRHGVVVNTQWVPFLTKNQLDDETPILPEIFHAAGYQTAHFGKWHVGPDSEMQRRGFDHVVTNADFRKQQREKPVLHDVIRRNYITEGYPFSGITSADGDDFYEIFLCNQAEKWLRQQANSDQPFFCCISTPGPHPGYVVPQRYADRYAPQDMPLWPNLHDDLTNKPSVHRVWSHQISEADSVSDDEWRTCIARYYAFCTLIDEQFGRLIALLDELDLAQDTLVLFVSDHGDLIGAHRLFDKGPMMYDEQLHIPLVMRWPAQIEAGSQCSEMITWLDLMPTLVEAAGLELPQAVDGHSLMPLMRQQQVDDWPDDVFSQYNGTGVSLYCVRCVRSRRYKYVYYPLDRDELYDLEDDPWEMTNLIDDPGYVTVRAEMANRMTQWLKKSDDMLQSWNVGISPMRKAAR